MVGFPHDSKKTTKSKEFLQEQIQRQGQQGPVLILLAVSCHEKQEQNDQKILGIQSLRQEIPEKIADAVAPSGIPLRPGMGHGSPGWTAAAGRRGTAGPVLLAWLRLRLTGWRLLPVGLLRLAGLLCLTGRRPRLCHGIAAEGPVRLGNIPVVHLPHLPASACKPPEPRNWEASPAIFAARMARSSF